MRFGRTYAYVLPQKINKKFGFTPSKLMTYFVLYKLEDEKLISSEFSGRRKYYVLTEKGKAALSDAKKLLRQFSKKA